MKDVVLVSREEAAKVADRDAREWKLVATNYLASDPMKMKATSRALMAEEIAIALRHLSPYSSAQPARSSEPCCECACHVAPIPCAQCGCAGVFEPNAEMPNITDPATTPTQPPDPVVDAEDLLRHSPKT